jgi:hypothetical protein
MTISFRKTLFITAIVLFASCTAASATHIRAADVLVERICGTNTYNITIIAYLNSTSTTPFGAGSTIFFGDGTTEIIPITMATLRPDLGENVSVAKYHTSHTFPEGQIFAITYVEHDRSTGILNIANSHDVAYATSVTIDTSEKFGCNRYPILQVVPLDRGCSGIAFNHSPGAIDLDGDSLSFEFSVPASGVDVLADYVSPADQRFYTDFEAGNETHDARPSIQIDQKGTVTWDAPGAVGEYSIAFKVVEWRINHETGEAMKISTTVRDMQIIIEACQNTRPQLDIPADLCVVAGTVVKGTIKGTDRENHPVKIEFFSDVFEFPLEQSPAILTPATSGFVPSHPQAEVQFQWNTNCSHVRQQSYQIVVKITDDPPTGPQLVSFETWTIKVVAPAPVPKDVSLNVIKNYGVLTWEDYVCVPAKMQIWRKVGNFPFTPDECYTGLPKGSGYNLIAQVDGAQKNFTDTNEGLGLFPGATYCYRLIAFVNDAKSIVSEEYCIGPVKRDAPVITKVSVEKTASKGSIRVGWLSPLDINSDQFPPPYQYHVFRASGFYGKIDIAEVNVTMDTTINDTTVNTIDEVFNYRIVAYSKPKFSETFIPVDTSAVASSVRLEATPGVGQILLHWRDSVPWSNVSAERPYHYIYRATGIAGDQEVQFIDSIQVIDNGFTYVDDGRFNNEPIASNRIYTYKVMTLGTYGNPLIPALQNYSQCVSLYPENTLLPCSPFVNVTINNCDSELKESDCGLNIFNNKIGWQPDLSDTCRIDIVGYKVYAAPGPNENFELLATTDSAGYVDRNLTSPSRCYRVSALDSKGQEGPLGEAICNDACPHFTLPNVFTPNGDGCNDLFTARYESANPGCPVEKTYNCPRFVKSVNIKIYNRWGKQVYEYFSDQPDDIYIDWDGKDSTGKEMATGVYYYVGEIEFQVLDEDRKKRVIKDWLHLVR